MLEVIIKENSFFARIAAWKLNAKSAAIVFGRTIHLYNATAQELFSNKQWLRHELKHVEQFRKHGFISFILHYLYESLRKGYYRNSFEEEARHAEKGNDLSGVDPVLEIRSGKDGRSFIKISTFFYVIPLFLLCLCG